MAYCRMVLVVLLALIGAVTSVNAFKNCSVGDIVVDTKPKKINGFLELGEHVTVEDGTIGRYQEYFLRRRNGFLGVMVEGKFTFPTADTNTMTIKSFMKVKENCFTDDDDDGLLWWRAMVFCGYIRADKEIRCIVFVGGCTMTCGETVLTEPSDMFIPDVKAYGPSIWRRTIPAYPCTWRDYKENATNIDRICRNPPVIHRTITRFDIQLIVVLAVFVLAVVILVAYRLNRIRTSILPYGPMFSEAPSPTEPGNTNDQTQFPAVVTDNYNTATSR